MFNSQYYTCEQIDQRLLQGYLDDYNSQNNTDLTKEQFLTLLFNTIGRNSTVDNLVTQIGYYECDTAAGTAEKAITVANYNLFAGGSIKVKFVNKNTANNATLNLNSQGAKALYYQGERASATNSWDAEEVVEIYYDGTSYYANNVKGGSGSGVYDVSKEHPTSGPNSDGKFTLEYILNSSNVNELIPVNKRYPGMSIQFVSTSDNKYIQARCMAQNFTTDVTQWQGVDAEPTDGSKNLVESGGVYSETTPLKRNINDIKKAIKPIYYNGILYISDSNGNVIAKIDSNGLSVTDVKVKSNSNLISMLTLLSEKVDKDGTKVLSDNNFTDELKEKLENLSSIFSVLYTDSLYISDSNGNVIVKIDSKGLTAYKIKDAVGDMRVAEGFQLFTIGDSLSAANKWQPKCAQILGCSFDASGNVLPGMQLSTGGSSTYGGGKDSAFFRIKNLYDQNVITNQGEKAIIVFENVNDRNASPIGNISDAAMVPTTPIETGIDELDFNTSYLDSIKSEHGALNTILGVERTVIGKKMTITTLPTVEGDIQIGTGWSGPGMLYYNIHVVPQATQAETLAYVVDKILENNYTGVSDFQGDEDNEIVFTNGRTSYETYLTFSDVGNTGMAVTIEETNNAKQSVLKFFIGESLDNWSDLDYWKDGTYLSLYRAYNSCIQYAMKKFPKAKIFIGGFPHLKLTPSSYLRANGTYDYEQYHNDAGPQWQKVNELYTILKNLADYYDIPYLDIAGNLGINLSNYSTYYNDNNPHPKTIGYERMGCAVASELKKYL